MPYHLMTDEHMCDRLASGEAERLASAPAEIVRYDGARWVRNGDMWVRDDEARRGAPTWRWRTPARRNAVEGTAPEASGAPAPEPEPAADPDPDPDPDAIPADPDADGVPADPDPVPGGASRHRGRGRTRRARILTGAACLATVSSVVLVDVTTRDHRRSDAISQLVTTAPQAVATPEAGVAEPDAGVAEPPAVPEPTAPDFPSAPADTPVTTPVPPADTEPVVSIPTSDPVPPSDDPSSPPPTPVPPSPPPVQPDTPGRAAAALQAEVGGAARAGQLGLRAQAALTRRAARIRASVDSGREWQARRRIRNMRRAIDRLRARQAISPDAVVVLEASLDRVARTL
jgi:hypothetical protein